MTPYVNAADLLIQFGSHEAAQISFPKDSTVQPDAALLEATIHVDDRSGWSAEQQAAADEAHTRLTEKCEAATAEAEGYLRAGGYALPPTSLPKVLRDKTGDLARYYLYDDRPTETVRTNYEDALAWFRAVAKRTVVLDLGNADESQTAGMPDYSTPGRRWTHDSLKDF